MSIFRRKNNKEAKKERTDTNNSNENGQEVNIVRLSIEKAEEMLISDSEKGLFEWNGSLPYIIELLQPFEYDAQRIFNRNLDSCKKSDDFDRLINSAKMSFIWSFLCGMGAVRLWHNDWDSLQRKGILNALSEERGFDELDEYVFDIIGIGWGTPECDNWMDRINERASSVLLDTLNPAIATDEKSILNGISVGCRAMYYYGMALEMGRLGMK